MAAEIKIRAERKLGGLLREMAEKGERDKRGGDRKSNSHDVSLKLSSLGITVKHWMRQGMPTRH